MQQPGQGRAKGGRQGGWGGQWLGKAERSNVGKHQEAQGKRVAKQREKNGGEGGQRGKDGGQGTGAQYGRNSPKNEIKEQNSALDQGSPHRS